MKTKYLKYIIFLRANQLLGKAGTYHEGLLIPLMWLILNHLYHSPCQVIVNIHYIIF